MWETGDSRYGLYGTFGKKKELWVAALRHYEHAMGQLLMSGLHRSDAGLSEIVDYWRTIGEHAKDEQIGAGCLFVNVAVEVAPHDEDVAAEVQRIDKDHQPLFARATRSGQSTGNIPNH